MRVFTLSLAAFAAVALGPMQAPAPKSVSLADIPWLEAEAALRSDTVVLIPLGSAAIEHGPHLKLGTDAILAEYLTRRVMDRTLVAVAPALPYHFEPAFEEYPGNATLSLYTARSLTVDVARSLSRFGPRRFYVLNAGTTTTAGLDAAVASLAADGILLGYTNIQQQLNVLSARVRRQEGGAHADEVETSMMLYVDPASVDMTRAAKDFSPPAAELRLTRNPRARGIFSASGVWGDPSLATAAKGRVVVEGLVDAIVSDIDALRQATPPAPGTRPATAPRFRPAGSPGGVDFASGCTPQDLRAILQIGDAYAVHWSNYDAEKLAALWSEEGDIVHPDETIERTRDTIRQNRMDMFNRREYRSSKHPLTLRAVRCVTGDVAVADGKWELRGVNDPGGKPLPTYEGQCTLVLHKAGNWLIEAYRYTIKPTATPLPTWLKRPGWPGK